MGCYRACFSVFLPLAFILTVHQAFSSSTNTSKSWKETISPEAVQFKSYGRLCVVKSCSKWLSCSVHYRYVAGKGDIQALKWMVCWRYRVVSRQLLARIWRTSLVLAMTQLCLLASMYMYVSCCWVSCCCCCERTVLSLVYILCFFLLQ